MSCPLHESLQKYSAFSIEWRDRAILALLHSSPTKLNLAVFAEIARFWKTAAAIQKRPGFRSRLIPPRSTFTKEGDMPTSGHFGQLSYFSGNSPTSPLLAKAGLQMVISRPKMTFSGQFAPPCASTRRGHSDGVGEKIYPQNSIFLNTLTCLRGLGDWRLFTLLVTLLAPY